MRRKVAAVLLSGVLLPMPAATRAPASQLLDTSNGILRSNRSPATHATRGVVTSIDATTLVIARFAQRGQMTFSLTPSTQREGTIVVGSTVSVRYRESGKSHIATAIAIQRPKD